MGKKINKPSKANSSKINQSATQLKSPDYDDRHGKVAFSKVCQNHCLISEWFDKELEKLIDCFKKIENMKWKDIKNDPGLDLEVIKFIALQRPKMLPPDATMRSIRVDGSKRLYGYRVEEYFYIIWFDKNHIVCPLNKPKPYAV